MRMHQAANRNANETSLALKYQFAGGVEFSGLGSHPSTVVYDISI